jgi:hypothetical protein
MLDTDHPAARSVPLIAYRNFPFALAVVPCSSPWTASADAVRILAPGSAPRLLVRKASP